MELCSSQRDDRLDLIETLGQRQCSAPGSGKRVPGSVEESGSIGDDWNVPGAHRDGSEIGRGARRRMSLCLHVPLPPSTVSLTLRQHGVAFDIPPHPGSPEGLPCRRVRYGARRTHRTAVILQSMPHATTHEGLIDKCRIYTDHAEDPSRTARENGQKARFPATVHGRSIREPRLCRGLQATRWE